MHTMFQNNPHTCCLLGIVNLCWDEWKELDHEQYIINTYLVTGYGIGLSLIVLFVLYLFLLGGLGRQHIVLHSSCKHHVSVFYCIFCILIQEHIMGVAISPYQR